MWELVCTVERQGGEIVRMANGSHIMVRLPDGSKMTFPHGRSVDPHALANARAELRRRGVVL